MRLTSDGVARTYAISVADVVGAGGALRLAALTDIEAEIQAAEAAALRELLQVLSHEMMNSLTPLASLAQSAAEMLADETAADLPVVRQVRGGDRAPHRGPAPLRRGLPPPRAPARARPRAASAWPTCWTKPPSSSRPAGRRRACASTSPRPSRTS